MKAFYVMFVMFAVLLLGAPMASAQDGSPSCPGGSAYDLTGHGCVTGYTNGSAAAASIAPKVAGLAAPAQAAQQNLGWPGCPWGDSYSPTEHGFVAECFFRPPANAAALKPTGLAKLAPAEGFVPCGAGENLDPLLDPQALACLMTQSVPAAKAASKPAGLAAPVPAVIPAQGLPCLPWGDAYDPLTMLSHGPECVSQPTDNSAAPKTAGLAKLTPVENFAPCGFSEQLDPLLDPLALACLSQSFPAAKAASKPVGLAAPAPAQEQFVPCGFGERLDPLALAYLSRPADNAAALKPAGLAKLTPVEAFVPCGFGERLDPLALACLSQTVTAAKAASKPAGLAAPAQEISSSLCDAGESPNRCP